MKNRKREICTSGSLSYSATSLPCGIEFRKSLQGPSVCRGQTKPRRQVLVSGLDEWPPMIIPLRMIYMRRQIGGRMAQHFVNESFKATFAIS
jgi:hypothetical protein